MSNSNLSVETLPEFNNHKMVSFIFDKKTGLRGFIAIHKGNLTHRAFGATRLWQYKSEIDGLKDALTLSKTMSYKAALAGLPYGGAKGVLIQPNGTLEKEKKRTLLKTYAHYINYLHGTFITGADVGIDENDVKAMRKESSFIVGVNVDPVKFTVIGIFNSIKECLKEVYGNDQLSNRSFAIQGLGKIGIGLLELLYKNNAAIYATDINETRMHAVAKSFPHVHLVKPDEIYTQHIDVFSPCALSNCLNSKTFVKLRCKMVVGGANSQLENSTIGEKLSSRGILYAPDYIVNAGGLISVVDEYEYTKHNEDRILNRVKKIPLTVRKVIQESKKLHKPTNIIADAMAEKIISKIV